MAQEQTLLLQKMNRKRKTGLMITATLIAVPALLFTLHSEDSHHFNMKYRMWKLGWTDYDPKFVRFLNVDVDLRHSLVGEDLESVERLFPDLRSKKKANEYQGYYAEGIEHRDYYWIGDTAWTVQFENGRLVEFHLWKG